MKKYFYSHILEIKSLHFALDTTNVTPEEKKHLFSLIESSLHTAILDAVLSELSESDKKLFLQQVESGDDKKVWNLLREKTEDIEKKISKIANSLIEELHRDIMEVKGKSL